jgi:hypothetical protein
VKKEVTTENLSEASNLKGIKDCLLNKNKLPDFEVKDLTLDGLMEEGERLVFEVRPALLAAHRQYCQRSASVAVDSAAVGCRKWHALHAQERSGMQPREQSMIFVYHCFNDGQHSAVQHEMINNMRLSDDYMKKGSGDMKSLIGFG